MIGTTPDWRSAPLSAARSVSPISSPVGFWKSGMR